MRYEIPSVPWIHAEPGMVDDMGMAVTGEWVLRVEPATFEACGAINPNIGSVCMARLDHEHPHVCCNSTLESFWRINRVVAVSHKSPMAIPA